MSKRITCLSVILLIALAVGLWLLQKPLSHQSEPKLLFVGFSQSVADIDSVHIESSTGQVLNAYLDEGKWVAEIGSSGLTYPLEPKRLTGLVNGLMAAKLVEAKTNRAENYVHLGLESIDVEDSLTRLVTIAANSQTWQVLVGNHVSIGEGVYVRFPNQTQSWRLNKNIELPVDQFAWLKHPILPYTTKDIQSLARIDNDTWTIVRDSSDDQFTLESMSREQTLQYPSVLSGFVDSVVGLDYEELVFRDEAFVKSLGLVTELELNTNDGLINVNVSTVNDEFYVNFVASESTIYWQNWYYKISNFSAQQLNKVTTDFLTDKSELPATNTVERQPVEEGASPK